MNGNKWKLILLFLTFSLLFFCNGCGKTIDHKGEAQIPEKASELKGLNYEEVQKKFSDAGFTNIELERLDDLITGWIRDEGEVKEVLVDGKDDYIRSTWIAADTPIIIRYHTFKEKKEPVEEYTYKDDNNNTEEAATQDLVENRVSEVNDSPPVEATESEVEPNQESPAEDQTPSSDYSDSVPPTTESPAVDSIPVPTPEPVQEPEYSSSLSNPESGDIYLGDSDYSQDEYESTRSLPDASVESGEYVYISETGTKYHNDPNCSNMNYTLVSIEQALAMGKEPCKKCYGG